MGLPWFSGSLFRMIIFICGFMGAGKSHLLESLQSNLNSKSLSSSCFLDLDQKILAVIQEMDFKSIADFIKSRSIKSFRELEYKVLAEVISSKDSKRVLVSLGGGCLEYQNSFELIKKSGKLLFINTKFEVCFERIKNDKNRPLAKNNFNEMKELYIKRLKKYELADAKGDNQKLSLIIKEWLNV